MRQKTEDCPPGCLGCLVLSVMVAAFLFVVGAMVGVVVAGIVVVMKLAGV